MVRNLLSFSKDSVIYPATSEFWNGNRDFDQRFFSKLNDGFFESNHQEKMVRKWTKVGTSWTVHCSIRKLSFYFRHCCYRFPWPLNKKNTLLIQFESDSAYLLSRQRPRSASFPGNVSIWRPFLFSMWTRNRNQEDNSNHYWHHFNTFFKKSKPSSKKLTWTKTPLPNCFSETNGLFNKKKRWPWKSHPSHHGWPQRRPSKVWVRSIALWHADGSDITVSFSEGWKRMSRIYWDVSPFPGVCQRIEAEG